ncbi:hypothetical protein [Leifsonia sp. Leaf264]|uniref:hypothetical protein n=1 Tax=Leifsonia sp. Leaf264 TaxID=1736314 RepID=UPI0007007BE9|nr:hypothetical protein [Leifsonia sp. Leaf264]KQO98875.1 hypothetical protein ASF30_12495 [Leifsonia sp. Leaf264]
MRASLTGFVGDIVGDEHRLTERTPVLSIGGREFVAAGLNWTRASLQPLHPSDEEFVWRLDGRAPIAAGETVWLAGPVFGWALHELGDDALRHWATGPRGFTYLSGSRKAFAALTSQTLAALSGKESLKAELLRMGLHQTLGR